MANVILAYGPGGTGKTQAAREWEQAADGRIIIEEFSLEPGWLFMLTEFLISGLDVWVNVTSGSFEPSFTIPGHTVWPRKFERPLVGAQEELLTA